MNVRYLCPCALALVATCITCNVQAASTSTIDFGAHTTKPTPAQNTAIRHAAASDIKEFDHPQRDDWRIAQTDLNADGHPDLLVQYTYDSSFCGSSGCSGVIVMATASGYATTPISLPNFMSRVHILATRHHGMPDLRFDDARYVFRWSGQAYQ